MRPSGLLVFLCLSLGLAPAAWAHHVSGTVTCDANWNGVLDAGDTPVAGTTARAKSLDVAPGTTWTDATDATGYFNIGLQARTDRYLVDLGLPGGWTVVSPAGGSYTVQIVTGTSQDHADGLNFLVRGCTAQPTTTTTTTTTSTTTSTTTTSTAAPTTTTTTTTSTTSTTADPTTTTIATPSTTTTTLPGACAEIPFLVNRDGRFNNDATILASIGANLPTATLRLSQNVFMPDGTVVAGNTVELGNGTNVFRVLARVLKTGMNVVVRDGQSTPLLPLQQPFCAVPALGCGDDTIQVSPGRNDHLPPGDYGTVRVLNGATLTLAPGLYRFCSLKTGRGSRVETLGAVDLDVRDILIVGSGTYLGPADGQPRPLVRVTGKKVRVSQGGTLGADLMAPNALVTLGRDSLVAGSFCTDRAKTDKHITLQCP